MLRLIHVYCSENEYDDRCENYDDGVEFGDEDCDAGDNEFVEKGEFDEDEETFVSGN